MLPVPVNLHFENWCTKGLQEEFSSRSFFPRSQIWKKRHIRSYWANSDCWKGTQPAIHGPSLAADKTENKSFWDSSQRLLFITSQWPERHGSSSRLIARALLKGHAIRFCSWFNRNVTDWLSFFRWTDAVLGKTWWSRALCTLFADYAFKEIVREKEKTITKKNRKWWYQFRELVLESTSN